MTLTSKKLFAIDSLGALLTSIMLGVMMTAYESVFGMPTTILYLLSLLAFLYSIYSFVSLLRAGDFWRRYLKIIAIANIFYCCFTLVLIIFFRQELNSVDWIYFPAEIVIILTLAIFELRVASKARERII